MNIPVQGYRVHIKLTFTLRGMDISPGSVVCEKTWTSPSPMTALTSFTTTLIDPGFCTPTITIEALDLTTPICTAIEVSYGDSATESIATLKNLPTTVMFGEAMAKPFTVYWQFSDLSRFPSDYASSVASVIKVPLENTTTLSSSTTSPTSTHSATDPDSKGSSLSPGAIAGIAIGVGALVISSIVVFLYLRRKRKQQQRLQHPEVPEMVASSRGLKRFIGGKWRAETDGTSQPVEAGSTSVRIIPGPPVELDGTQMEREQ